MSTRNTLGTGQNNSTYMNSKNKGIIMLLVAAVIVGIIGGVALITYMKPQKTTVYTFKDGVFIKREKKIVENQFVLPKQIIRNTPSSFPVKKQEIMLSLQNRKLLIQ